jgi:hypothetical protein
MNATHTGAVEMDRKYEIAGTSFYKRVMTFRFADGSAKVREGVLRRAGHEDIQLHQLPTPMTKEAASAWLTQQGLSRGAVMPWGHRNTKNPKKVSREIPAKTEAELAAEAKAAKLAAKRARDAARKREQRANARAAKAAAAQEVADS